MKNKQMIRKINHSKYGNGGHLANWAKGLGRFALGNIPIFGDNIVNQIPALRDFEPNNKVAKGLLNFNEDVLNPAKDTIAVGALDTVAPGLGSMTKQLDNGLGNMQNRKDSSKSLGEINPRYAQTGGKVVPGGIIKPLSSTASLAEGNLHKDGGIQLNKDVEVEGGEGIHKIGKSTVVSSDSLENPETGKTFAEEMTNLEAHKGRLEGLLAKELKKTEGKSNSTILVYKKKIKEISDAIKQLYMKQESVASQMGLRDKNGNPNQTSQDIVETPQNQNMGSTEAFKTGGRIRKFKRYQYGATVPNIPGLTKKAKDIENQKIYDNEPDFNDDSVYLPELEIIGKRKKPSISALDILSNLNFPKNNNTTSTHNPVNYSQSAFTPITTPIQNQSKHYQPYNNTNTQSAVAPSINNNNERQKVEFTTNVTSPQRDILINNRQDAYDDLKMKLGKYNPITSNNKNFRNVTRQLLNIPIKAQMGLTGNSGLFDMLNQQKGLIAKQQSPLLGNGILKNLQSFTETPNFPTLNKQQNTLIPKNFGEFQGLKPVPLKPLQSQTNFPLFPNAKPIPLKEFNKRGFGNDNIVLLGNIGTQLQDRGSGEQGNGGISADDGKNFTNRIIDNRIKKAKSDGLGQEPVDILKKSSIGNLFEKETNNWIGSIAEAAWEQSKINEAKKKQEDDINAVKDKFNTFSSSSPSPTTPTQTQPPTQTQSPTQTKPKQSTYEVRNDVKAFQEWYNNNLPPGAESLDVDGKYGPATKAAYGQSKDQWRTDYHGKPLEPEQQPVQVAETSPGYEEAKANGGEIIIIDGKEAIKTPDGKVVYRDGSSTTFNPSTTSKYGGNLSKLKRFQGGGYTKVGTTTNNKDMYRNDSKGGMYEDSELYGDYDQMNDGKGSEINYGISNTHYKRNDIPVIGGNTTNNIKPLPQTIPSKPIPQSIPTPKPIINNNNSIGNAGNTAIGLVPGIGDISQDSYTKKDGITYKNGQVWNHPGFNHDWKIKGIDIDNPGKVLFRGVNDFPVIPTTPKNYGLPLNSNMLTGKTRSVFNNYGRGRQLETMPKYDFNYNTNKQLIVTPNNVRNFVMDALDKQDPDILRALQKYGLHNINGLGESQLQQLQKMIDSLSDNNKFKYGGNISKYKSGGWIGKVTKSIKRRGTEGRCSGSNFGGPGCPPGSRQYNLAVTFKNMARNKKHKYGGKVYDQKGYLKSNLNNFTSKKIIRGKNGYTPITTNDMALPIYANGKLLYPNTGDYIFPGNEVVERPVKAAFGHNGLIKPQDANLNKGNAYNNIMNPTPFSVTGNTTISANVETDDEKKVREADEAKQQRLNKISKIAEPILATSPLLTEGAFQLFSKNYDDLKRKYPTQNRYGQGLSEMQTGMMNALPNARKMINDNQLSTLATTLNAASNAGENVGNIANSVVPQIQKSANELYATTISNLQNQYAQYHQFTKAIEDAKAQEDYQTYTQALKNRQDIQQRLQDSISKSLENLNAYATTYGPEGQKKADQMFFDMLKEMPWLGQNDNFRNYAKKYGFDVTPQGTLTASSSAKTPSVNGKYGGNIRI